MTYLHRRRSCGDAGVATAPPEFGNMLKFGQMGWDIRAFGGRKKILVIIGYRTIMSPIDFVIIFIIFSLNRTISSK